MNENDKRTAITGVGGADDRRNIDRKVWTRPTLDNVDFRDTLGTVGTGSDGLAETIGI